MTNKKVMRDNPAFNRTGTKQNYATKLMAQFNWKRRALTAVTMQLQQNILWAESNPGWEELSVERRAAVRHAYRACEQARKQCQAAITAINDIRDTPLYAPELVETSKEFRRRESNRRSGVEMRKKKGALPPLGTA